MNLKYAALIVVVLGCATSSAQAVLLNVENHSFEDGPTSSFMLPDNLVGWDINTAVSGSTAGQTLNPAFFTSPASDSSPRHFFTNEDGTLLTQETPHVIQQNYIYTLTGEFGKRLGQNHAFTEVSVQLWAKDNLNNLTNLGTTTVPAANVPSGAFQAFSAAYTDDGTHAGSTIVVQFGFNGGSQPALDVVTLDEILVPEPGSIGLLLVGSLGLSCLLLHRRKRS